MSGLKIGDEDRLAVVFLMIDSSASSFSSCASTQCDTSRSICSVGARTPRHLQVAYI